MKWELWTQQQDEINNQNISKWKAGPEFYRTLTGENTILSQIVEKKIEELILQSQHYPDTKDNKDIMQN